MIEDYPVEFWQWIESHANDDPIKLRLGASKWSEPWIGEAINQVQRRKRCSKRLPILLSEPQVFIPTDLSIEQSTSEALAHYHASLINEGDIVVDLTAGLGIDAMTMAHRAKYVTAVERDTIVAAALVYNATVHGYRNLSVVNTSCEKWLQEASDDGFRCDVCYIDPARRGDNGQRVYGLDDCSPNVITLLPTIANICNRLIVKMSPMLDITSILRNLPYTCRIISLGTSTECKELIAIVAFQQDTTTPLIEAVTIKNHEDMYSFAYTRDEEADTQVNIAMPNAGDNLYIPYPAVMKAGGLKVLCQRYGLSKPDANTQLFYCSEIIDDFPGQRLKIVEVLPYASSVIKRLNRRYPTAMVSERNMGISSDILRRKLAVRDGDEVRIIGFSAGKERFMLIAR